MVSSTHWADLRVLSSAFECVPRVRGSCFGFDPIVAAGLLVSRLSTVVAKATPSESDAARAIVFIALISERISDITIGIPKAELAESNARRLWNPAAERRARILNDDIRAESEELARQPRAIYRRFPELRDHRRNDRYDGTPALTL